MTKIEQIKYFVQDIPELVKMYHYAGDFEGEIAAIEMFLSRDTLPDCLKERLRLQKLTAEVLLKDYRLDDEEFVNTLNSLQDKKKITVSDIDEICKFQNSDYILVKGGRKWQHQQAINVVNQHPEFFDKDFKYPDKHDNEITDKMAENGGMAWHFRLREEFTINDEAIIPGKKVRVWLPYPVINETQPEEKMKVLEASHPYEITGDNLRMVFFETEAKKGDTFFVEYEYENHAKYHDPMAVKNSKSTFDDIKANDGELFKYTREEYPQTVFTPYIKMLAEEITKGLTRPGEMAYAVYTWITDNVKYSYLRDYLIIPNIPEFVAINGYGDCGAMTLLFITILRYLGIPARWQSGNGVSPGHMGSHDWCRFYIPEFGWLYCDPSYGVGAKRFGNEKRRLHYFCNIDAFRMVAVDDFMVELTPAKKHTRMDPYDNQSGEAEYADGSRNIFYQDHSVKKICISAEPIEEV